MGNAEHESNTTLQESSTATSWTWHALGAIQTTPQKFPTDNKCVSLTALQKN